MVDLTNLRVITAELDNAFGNDLLHADFPSVRLDVFKMIIDKIDNYVILIDKSLKVVMVNQKTQELLQKEIGKCVCKGDDWYKTVFGLDVVPIWDPITRAINNRKVVIKTIESPHTGLKFNTINIPVIYNGVSGVVGIGVDDFNESS